MICSYLVSRLFTYKLGLGLHETGVSFYSELRYAMLHSSNISLSDHSKIKPPFWGMLYLF